MDRTEIALEDLASLLEPGQRLLGLDIGTKTIGLALSDETRAVASPLQTITRTKFTPDAEEILRICTENNVSALILGLPLNMNGTEGPRAQSTRAFARNLRQLTDLAIAFWDERLSTAAVTRTLIEAQNVPTSWTSLPPLTSCRAHSTDSALWKHDVRHRERARAHIPNHPCRCSSVPHQADR